MSIEIPKDFILFLIAGLLAQVVDSQNPIPSRLKTVQDSPIPKTACVDGKITSMICLTSHVMQQRPNSSVILTKQHLMRTRTLTQSQAMK